MSTTGCPQIDVGAVEENAPQIVREGGHALGVRVDVAKKAELKQFAVNLKGPFLLSQLVAKQMIGRGGVIINLASVNSVVAHPDLVPYARTPRGDCRRRRLLGL